MFNGKSPSSNDMFEIDGTTGQITVARTIDRETDGDSMNMQVTATDGGTIPLSTNTNVYIQITGQFLHFFF
jgi:hypothetical protein